jgi:hypothetical protein
MKLPEVRKYANEITGLVKDRDNAQAAIDHITALMRAANSSGDRNQQLALEKQRSTFIKQSEAIEKELLSMSKARDFEGARQLQIDVSLRIDAAMKAYVEWRRMANEYEYSVTNNLFAPEPEPGQEPAGFTRIMADIELDRAKDAAELRAAFAGQIVPERPVLLL